MERKKNTRNFTKDERGLLIPQTVEGLIVVAFFLVGILATGIWGYNYATKDTVAGPSAALAITGEVTPALTAAGETSLMRTLIATGLLGKASTVTIKAYDKPSDANTEVSSSINASVWISQRSIVTGTWGEMVKVKDKDTYTLGDASITDISVGDKISVYGMDAAYYCDPRIDVIVEREKQPIVLNCYQASTDTNMDVQGYDDTGSTELSGATNASISNADITMGAGQTKLIFLKLTNNHGDRVRDVCAISVIQQNQSKSAKITGVTQYDSSGLAIETVVADSSGRTPDHQKTASMNSTQIGQNWEDTWVFGSVANPNALRLSEWQNLKVSVELKTGTVDPASQSSVDAYKDSSVWAFIFKDCTWSEDRAGNPIYGFYESNTDNENDVGIDEDDTETGADTTSGTSNSDSVAYSIEAI